MRNAKLSTLLELDERVRRHMEQALRLRNGLWVGILVDNDEPAILYQRRNRFHHRLRKLIDERVEAIECAPAVVWHEGAAGAPEGVMLLAVAKLIMGNRMRMGYVEQGVWRLLVGTREPGREELYVPSDRIQLWAELPRTPAHVPVYSRR